MTEVQKIDQKTASPAIAPERAAGIAAALARAQSEMGKALKESNNPHFRSKYADLGNVMDACMPSLSKHGIAVIQPTGMDELGQYVETVLIHGETGEKLSCRVPLIVQKNDMQGYGSAVTYARRYGLMAMAGIAPEDDDGNAAKAAAPQKESQPQFNPRAAADRVIGKLRRAKSLDDLKDAWRSEQAVISEIKEAAGLIYEEIEKASLACRDALTPAPSADLGDDEIPY